MTRRKGAKTNKNTTVDENESSNDSDSHISNKSKELPDQYKNEKYQFFVKIGYEVYFHKKVIKNLHTTIPLLDPDTDIPDIEGIFRTTLKGLTAETEAPLFPSINFNNAEDWSLSSFDMAIPIKEITELVKEYDGDPKKLNTFVKNIDRLWNHINGYEDVDKDRFMLTLQLKLTEKAATATKDVDFANWPAVKKALKENINPQKNIEKAELKLIKAEQEPKESVEDFAKRIEELLENLNKSFNLEEDIEILTSENDRKARKAFEDGLKDEMLKRYVIARGNKTLRESVDYVIEMELRRPKKETPEPNKKFCTYCKMDNHEVNECRRRKNQQSDSYRGPNLQNLNNSYQNRSNSSPNYPNREITCYTCNKKGHYARECMARNGPPNDNQQNEDQ